MKQATIYEGFGPVASAVRLSIDLGGEADAFGTAINMAIHAGHGAVKSFAIAASARAADRPAATRR